MADSAVAESPATSAEPVFWGKKWDEGRGPGAERLGGDDSENLVFFF